MSRTKFIFILTVVLMLGAGVVVGRLWANLPVITHSDSKPEPWTRQAFDLTAEQQKQWDAIWADARQRINETFDQRKTLDRERDQAIAALLSPEQYISYEEIQQEYRDERGSLDKVRHKLVDEAQQRTKALLNPDQLKRWEEMEKQHHAGDHGPASRPGGPGFGFGGGPRGPHPDGPSGEH